MLFAGKNEMLRGVTVLLMSAAGAKKGRIYLMPREEGKHCINTAP